MKKRDIGFTPLFLIAIAAWHIASKYFGADFDAISGVNKSWLVIPSLWLLYLFVSRIASTLSLMGLTACVWHLLTANGVIEGSGLKLSLILIVILAGGIVVWVVRLVKRLLGSTFDTLTAEPCWKSMFGFRSYSYGSGPFKSGQLTAVLGGVVYRVEILSRGF